jgi:predicted site-specific integrase-resolvase
MAIEIDGQTYYRTSEACKKTGINRATLFRWLKAGILEKYHKDRRGWMMFSEEDLIKIRAGVKKDSVEYAYPESKNDEN